MNFEDRESLRNKAIELYLNGNNFSQIAKVLNYSRQFIANLIKNDSRVKAKRNMTTIKVYKNRKRKKMRLGLSTTFLKAIGIDEDCLKTDYVDVFLDEENKQIIIRKHDL